MTIRIPWPEGLTPEEIRQREKERDERIANIKAQLRQEFEAALANKDVRAMSALALAAIGRLSGASRYGMRWSDIDDLQHLVHELAIEGELLVGQRRNLHVLDTVLAVKGNDLRGTAPSTTLERLFDPAPVAWTRG